MAKKPFSAKVPKKESVNENEIIHEDIEIKAEKKETEKEIEAIENFVKNYTDTKIRFAKVNWGAGKGPYILAFDSSCDYDYCECNSHEFKPLKDSDIKQNHVHIWECGSKLPEQINKLPTLDIEKYREEMKDQKLKKKEDKNATK